MVKKLAINVIYIQLEFSGGFGDKSNLSEYVLAGAVVITCSLTDDGYL